MIAFLVSLALLSPAQAQQPARGGSALGQQIARCISPLMRGRAADELAIRFKATPEGRIVTDSLRISARGATPRETSPMSQRMHSALARCLERRFGAIRTAPEGEMHGYLLPIRIGVQPRRGADAAQPDPSIGRFLPQMFMLAVAGMMVNGLAVLLPTLRYAATKTVKG